MWFRVEADYGKGFVFQGDASDRIGYLVLATLAWQSGAKAVELYLCRKAGTGITKHNLFKDAA